MTEIVALVSPRFFRYLVRWCERSEFVEPPTAHELAAEARDERQRLIRERCKGGMPPEIAERERRRQMRRVR